MIRRPRFPARRTLDILACATQRNLLKSTGLSPDAGGSPPPGRCVFARVVDRVACFVGAASGECVGGRGTTAGNRGFRSVVCQEAVIRIKSCDLSNTPQGFTLVPKHAIRSRLAEC